jgi:phage terminase large subunit
MFDWKQPDYAAVLAERGERLKRLRAMKPVELLAIKEFYREHPVEFINDWGMTSDPRNVEVGLPVNIPFLLFPKQAEFVEWVYDRWRAREDGLAEKSRDMGVSWLCVAIACHMFLFFADMQIGFGSRKEEYVDEIGNLKALFPKIRMFIDLLPREFRPDGWNGGKFMLINNPENGASIIGEAGDNIGRGARTGIYFKDESAFYERSEKIEAALSQTSNCKIDVSTPNGSGNSFYRKRHAGKTKVFTFHWKDDPRKGQAGTTSSSAIWIPSSSRRKSISTIPLPSPMRGSTARFSRPRSRLGRRMSSLSAPRCLASMPPMRATTNARSRSGGAGFLHGRK